MMNPLEKFQDLLRELFQFNCADLDFGIYRIMNQRHDAIERFITHDLPEAVATELRRDTLAEQSRAVEELRDVAAQISQTLGEDALDASGNLSEAYHTTPLGKKYRALIAKAAGACDHQALEANIFNHLYSFFSRYYQDGDFISKRRYSKGARYSVPYNGEEVYLHWANSDQYYVKTAEYFTDYTFTSAGVTVHFKMHMANVEQNNVKGEKRFFLPRLAELAWDEASRQLVIPFEYRPLTEQEKISYGQKNQQEVINEEAIERIPRRLSSRTSALALAALAAEKRKDGEGHPVSFLKHHLRQYTRRNTSDYFIHKDLKGFLSRELDFYLKNEVLNLDEIDSANEDRAEGWFQIMRAIRTVGGRIIEFLHQIEEFQKMLWEKRKFIIETQYCISVGNVPEHFYEEIAECEHQWTEWKELLHIDEEHADLFTRSKGRKDRRVAFLRTHPTLMLDSKHFDHGFVDRLLGGFDDLDAATDGLLVRSENFQALGLLLEKYRSKVKCTYLDPPYNSKTTEILYKNSYKHSSWLALMDNRLDASKGFAAPDGSVIIAVDENEQEVLGRLLLMHFPEHERVCVSVVHNKKGIQGDYFSYCHDYAYFCIPRALPGTHGRPIPQSEWEYDNLRKWGRESERETARNCFYPIYVENGEIAGFGEVCAEDFHPKKANVTMAKSKSRVAVYPIDSQGVERKWRYARETVEKIRYLLMVHVTTSGEIQILKAKAERQFKTVWDEPIYIAGDYGTKWLTDLGLKVEQDLYPKSIFTVRDSIFSVAGTDALILDYFAGSGTTGHAAINLNREDGGRRSFILVEMAAYFDTVLLPRVKKIAYTPEWKDGKPKRGATEEEAKRGPRIVKYIRLESYEDALNNIAFEDGSGQQNIHFEDYLLQYMLEWETRKSETMLHVERLVRPFNYRLRFPTSDHSSDKVVDMAETFNYLVGLHVQVRRVYMDGDRRYLVYRGQVDDRRIAVIWRETENWQEADFERDRQFVMEQKLTESVDEVFINGDSIIPGSRALEPILKARMFAPVEA